MKKLIIFDFDGVLSNSFSQTYTINKKAADSVSSHLTKKIFRSFFSGNIHKNIEIFLSYDKNKIDKFTTFKYQIFPKYYNSRKVKLFDFAVDFIRKIGKKADLCIVSSAPDEAIAHILKENQLNNFFKEIIGLNKKGKRVVLQKFADKKREYSKVYFITDTEGDLIETEGTGITRVAVTWGYHKEKILRKQKPDYIARNAEELLSFL